MITSKLKDELLKKLLDLSNETGKLRFGFSLNDVAKELGISIEILRKLLKHFQDRGLIRAFLTKDNTSPLTIELEIEAFDFHKLGFRGEKLLREKRIEKLLLEINQLKPSFSEKTQQINSVLQAIRHSFAIFLKVE